MSIFAWLRKVKAMRKANGRTCPCGKTPGCVGYFKGLYLCYIIGDGVAKMNLKRASECFRFRETLIQQAESIDRITASQNEKE